MTEVIELSNHRKIRTLEENVTYKYLGISEVDTIVRAEMQEKFKKNILGKLENYSKPNYIAETSSKRKTHGLSTLKDCQDYS